MLTFITNSYFLWGYCFRGLLDCRSIHLSIVQSGALSPPLLWTGHGQDKAACSNQFEAIKQEERETCVLQSVWPCSGNAHIRLTKLARHVCPTGHWLPVYNRSHQTVYSGFILSQHSTGWTNARLAGDRGNWRGSISKSTHHRMFIRLPHFW